MCRGDLSAVIADCLSFCESGRSGSEELRKCLPPSLAVLWFVNGRERKPSTNQLTGFYMMETLVIKDLKKRFQHRCFPVNFVKSLRIPFLQKTSLWLLLIVPEKSHLVRLLFRIEIFLLFVLLDYEENNILIKPIRSQCTLSQPPGNIRKL